jgi:hypothetical protein
MIDKYAEAKQLDEIGKMDDAQRQIYLSARNSFNTDPAIRQFKEVINSYNNMVATLEEAKK